MQVFRLSTGDGDTASAPDAQDEGKQLAEASGGTGTQPVLELTEEDIADALDAATAEPGSTAGQTQVAEAPARNVTPPAGEAMPLDQKPAAQVPPAVSAQPSGQTPEMAPDLAFAPPAISGKFGDTPFVTGRSSSHPPALLRLIRSPVLMPVPCLRIRLVRWPCAALLPRAMQQRNSRSVSITPKARV
ncbi:hypothetical protein V6L77_17705 [Pannonibacter sp. Pt2-lr]